MLILGFFGFRLFGLQKQLVSGQGAKKLAMVALCTFQLALDASAESDEIAHTHTQASAYLHACTYGWTHSDTRMPYCKCTAFPGARLFESTNHPRHVPGAILVLEGLEGDLGVGLRSSSSAAASRIIARRPRSPCSATPGCPLARTTAWATLGTWGAGGPSAR